MISQENIKASTTEKVLKEQSLASLHKTTNLIQIVAQSPTQCLVDPIKKLRKCGRLLLQNLVSHMNVHEQVYVSWKWFRRVCGISRTSVYEGLRELEASGIIVVVHRGCDYKTNIYDLSTIYKDPYIRKLCGEYVKAFLLIPLRLLRFSLHPAHMKKFKHVMVANLKFCTPNIILRYIKQSSFKKILKEPEIKETEPPKTETLCDKKQASPGRFQQRVRTFENLPENSQWNIPYPWKVA